LTPHGAVVVVVAVVCVAPGAGDVVVDVVPVELVVGVVVVVVVGAVLVTVVVGEVLVTVVVGDVVVTVVVEVVFLLVVVAPKKVVGCPLPVIERPARRSGTV
jgi:hypothetical protein